MAFSYCDSVIDFDLNILQQPGGELISTVQSTKQNKAVLRLKERIISTESVIRRYCKKKLQLQETQKKWKKASLDYTEALKKVYDLENDLQSHKQRVETLIKVNEELQQSYEYAETAKLAIKAHLVQLQVLLKQHENRIENLKSENKTAENKDTKVQEECNKKLLASMQQNKQLLYHIQILRKLIVENKKPNKHQKRILKKYENPQDMKNSIDLNDSKNHLESIEEGSDLSQDAQTIAEKLEEVHEHESLEKRLNPVKKRNGSNILAVYAKSACPAVDGKIPEVSNKLIDACVSDFDSELSNEPASSVDTGCGSSLACSDVEKGFFGSEYSESNSPLSIDTLMSRKEIKAVTVATSPITVLSTQDAGTNPIKFYNHKSIGIQHDTKFDERSVCKSSKNMNIQCDILSEHGCRNLVATGQILGTDDRVPSTRESGTNPIKFYDYKSIGIQHDSKSEELNICNNGKNINMLCDSLSEHMCRNVEVQCNLKSGDKEIKCVSTQCDSMADKMDFVLKQFSEAYTQSDFILEDFNGLTMDKKSSVTANAPESPHKKCQCFTKKRHKIDKQKSTPSIEEEQLNQDEVDSEVTTILNEMRLDFAKITPIPLSPVPSCRTDNNSVYLKSDNETLCSQLQVLTKTVMAIASALNVHGISVSNVNENITTDAKESPKDKNISIEKDVTEEFVNATEESESNICNLVKKNSKKSQNVSAIETEDNLKHFDSSKRRKNETVETRNTLDNVNSENLINCTKEVKNDQNSGDKLYERERMRKTRKGKVTKLQKMRKSVLPRHKIKKDLALIPRNISSKTLNRKCYINKENNKKLKSMELLNNKAAYEKALKVVAEMRQKDSLAKKFGKKTIFLKPNTKKKMIHVSVKQIEHSDTERKKILDDIIANAQDHCSNKNTNNLSTSPIPIKNVEISNLNSNKKCINSDGPGGGDGNVCVSKHMKNFETVKKCETKKNACLEKKSLVPQVVPEETVQECKNSEDVFVNDQKQCSENTVVLNTFSPTRQSTRLSMKRLSSQSQAKNRGNKRQKRHSLKADEFVSNDEVSSTSDNSKISVQESDMHTIKFNAVQNNSVVQIRRLSNEEIEKSIKQVDKSQEYVPVNKTDNKQVHSFNNSNKNDRKNSIKSYNDLDMFSENTNAVTFAPIQSHKADQSITIQRGYFCQILDKYLKNKKHPKPLSENIIKNIYIKLDTNIVQIINLKNNEVNEALKKFAEGMQDVSVKHFVAAVVTFLQSPKKVEDVICKTATPPAPPMAKSEQILLYLLKHLNSYQANVNLFDMVMDSIAYKLFKLNSLAPGFEEVESLSHFYAVLCRYTRAKNKLRLFILDAMYCLSYKAIPVIKQCLDVWMHILPLAHMGLAKSPLVITLVYLLHFYRCDDQSGRVQNIRMLLRKRYSYEMGEWNETKIIEMFKDAITHIREVSIEKKMLRMSLILIAKRHGVEWCQKNIVIKLLMPMIEDKNASQKVRGFCVSLLGTVMRPYPKHMRLHCEVAINQIFEILGQEESPQFQEALFTSLIYLSRHSLKQVVKALLEWKPLKVSPALEELLKDFVQEKSLKSWHNILSQNLM